MRPGMERVRAAVCRARRLVRRRFRTNGCRSRHRSSRILVGMDEETEVLESAAQVPEDGSAAAAGDPISEADREPAPPIESRFLYVDVASQRAKQLRRGALPRLEEMAGDSEVDSPARLRHKLERIAMSEVDRGKIHYDVPDPARGE